MTNEYRNLRMSDDEHTNDTDNKDIFITSTGIGTIECQPKHKQITLTKEEEEDSLKQEFSPTTATRGQTITTENKNKGIENVQKENLSLSSDEFTSDIEDDDDDKDDYFCPNNSFNVHSINEIEIRQQENNHSSPSPMDDGEFSIMMSSRTLLTTRGEQKQRCSDSNTHHHHHDKSFYFSRASSDLRPQCTTTTKNNEITRHLPSKRDEIEQQSNGSLSEDVGFTSDIHDDDDDDDDDYDMDHFLRDGSNCFPPNMMKGSYSKAADLSTQVEEQTTNVSSINNVEHDDDGFNSDIEDDSNNNCDMISSSVIQVVESQNWSGNLHEDDREVVRTRCSYDRFDDGFTSDIEEDG